MSSSFLNVPKNSIKEELLKAYSSIDPTIRRDALIQKLTREQMAEMMDDLLESVSGPLHRCQKPCVTRRKKRNIYTL